jgi:hypothetical protein
MPNEKQLALDAALRYDDNITKIEAMIAAYRAKGSSVSVFDVMFDINDVVLSQFNAATTQSPDPWDED